MVRTGLAAAFIGHAGPGAFAAGYAWNFDSGDLAIAAGSSSGSMNYRGATEPLTFFETTGGTYPHINGQPAEYLRHDAWPGAANDPSLGYELSFDASGPNGGGIYLNQYSFLIDILVPGPLDYVPLFQTDNTQAAGNDADWYIAPDGSFGIGALGYTTPGLISPNTWYRLGFVADLGANDVRYYLNGTRVLTTTATGLLDGRFAMYSNADPGADLILFNENDTSGNYSHAGLYNSIGFIDQPLTDAQMAALGGPVAAGIAVPEPAGGLLILAGAMLLAPWRRRSNSR